MKLSLFIVNYNTEKFIVKLLQSLINQTLKKIEFEIIIINNCQNNELLSAIQEYHFDKIFNLFIHHSQSNLGFGKAMNLAFSYAKGEHILLINPDVQMLQDDFLEKLLLFTNLNSDYGAISTQIINDNKEDVSTYYAYEFGETLGFDGEICWFEGSLLLVRYDVFEALDGFDPDFFMYCEDVDLCLRIKKMGLKLIKNQALKVYHFGGASETCYDIEYYKRRIASKLLFAKKHYSKEVFFGIVNKLYNKSKKRVCYYTVTSFFIKKHRRHLLQNIAIYELTKTELKK